MVILKIILRTEEENGRIMNIICISEVDSYHVPVINDVPFNGSLPKNTCLVCNTRYFRNGSGLKISSEVTQNWHK